MADSFLNSFAAELATASTTCGAIAPFVSACRAIRGGLKAITTTGVMYTRALEQTE